MSGVKVRRGKKNGEGSINDGWLKNSHTNVRWRGASALCGCLAPLWQAASLSSLPSYNAG